MENQHQKISGYRDLSHDEINAMNGAKHLEAQFNGLIDYLKQLPGVDQRQVALAATHGEDAFMQKCYLAVFFTPMPHIAGEDYHDCQYALFATVLPEADVPNVVPCKRGYAWNCAPRVEQASFETLSVTPSLDASKAGCWHGFITNGDCKP